jgi:raffinose/stachyose/melibiose transport system permease protein
MIRTIVGRQAFAQGEQPVGRPGPKQANASKSLSSEASWAPYLYLAPGLALVITFVLVPVARTFYLSFENWEGVGPVTWAGFTNYKQLWENPLTRALFEHSFELVIFYSVLPICTALFITALLGRRPIRFMTTYRAVLFFPQAIALVVSGVAWQWMYAQNGPVNQILDLFRMHSQTAWLGSFSWALPAIGLIGSWLEVGFCMVLFLAGAQKIDAEYYDAAEVDGAKEWQSFLHVTLPQLRAEIAVAFIITVIGALKSFDVVYVLTDGGGGPGNATNVPGLQIFLEAFTDFQVGSAASLAVVLAVLVLIVTVLVARLTRSPDVQL